jgi:hypothetical protein
VTTHFSIGIRDAQRFVLLDEWGVTTDLLRRYGDPGRAVGI